MVKDKDALKWQIAFARKHAANRIKPTKKGQIPKWPDTEFWRHLLTLDDKQMAKLLEKCYEEKPSKIVMYFNSLRKNVAKQRKMNTYVDMEKPPEIFITLM